MDMKGSRLGLEDYKSTTRDIEEFLHDFKAKGVDAVILDLRRNGGGSLVEAVSLTGLFIDEGPVVQVKDSDGRVQQLRRSGSRAWLGMVRWWCCRASSAPVPARFSPVRFKITAAGL